MIDIAPEFPSKHGYHSPRSHHRKNRGGPDASDDVRLPHAKDTGCRRAGVKSCFECPLPECVQVENPARQRKVEVRG